jgi:hypothetical protein
MLGRDLHTRSRAYGASAVDGTDVPGSAMPCTPMLTYSARGIATLTLGSRIASVARPLMLVCPRAARATTVRRSAARGWPSSRAACARQRGAPRAGRRGFATRVAAGTRPRSDRRARRRPARSGASAARRAGRAARWCTRPEPVGLDLHELYLELDIAAKHAQDETSSVAGLAPAPRRDDPHQARPVLGPVAWVGDVVEAVVHRDRETAVNLDANRSDHASRFLGSSCPSRWRRQCQREALRGRCASWPSQPRAHSSPR